MATWAAPCAERPQNMEARRLRSVLEARLKAAAGYYCQSRVPEFEHPMTPSTATGGYTARSLASARGTPTPSARAGGSRPSSALLTRRPTTAQSSRSARTADALETTFEPSMDQTPQLPQSPVAACEAAADSAGLQLSPAEQSMEDRMRVRRNHEVANQVAGQHQHAAVSIWAERRARIEEEVLRNAEASRFQSQLRRRGHTSPADAWKDIEATASAGSEASLAATAPGVLFNGSLSTSRASRSRPSSASRAGIAMGMSLSSARGRQRPQSAMASTRWQRSGTDTGAAATGIGSVAVMDVSAVYSTGHLAGPEIKAPSFEAPPRSELSESSRRIAHLRKVHARLLQECEDPDIVGLQNVPPTVDEACLASQFAKEEDDADVLASVCDWWRCKDVSPMHVIQGNMSHGLGPNLDEMRFEQMQEVEEVKRVFARRGCPVDVDVLENALVQPLHRLGRQAQTALLNTEPRLNKNPLGQAAVSKPKVRRRPRSAAGPGKRSAAGKDRKRTN